LSASVYFDSGRRLQGTHIRAIPNLLNSGIVERAGVSRELVDLVILLNAGVLVTFSQAAALEVALVDIRGPSGVSINLVTVETGLEGDNVLSGNLFSCSARLDGSSKDGRKEGSEKEE
jgi:hypothetical protein